MVAPKKEAVLPSISTHFRDIVSALSFAWKSWQDFQVSDPYRGPWLARGRANFIWEQATAELVNLIGGNESIRIIEENHTRNFIADQIVCFRLKKADSDYLSKNYATQLALSFHDHEVEIPGLDDFHRVEVVYVLSYDDLSLYDIAVVARDKEIVAWTHSLLEAMEDEIIVEFPISEDAPDYVHRVLKVSKRVSDEKSRDEGGG